jgi:outer membrane protein OmpA-like peptidoglycan-associated protein
LIRNHLAVLLTLGLVGCAATIPTELSQARDAYHRASSGPAATLVPADVHKAHEALLAAESAFKDEPRGYEVKDLAYVAERKAELAEALAATASEAKVATAANQQYQAAQDAIMKGTKAQLDATRSDLGTSQSNLAAAQTAGAQTAAQLATSEAARALAETRAAEALRTLARLASTKEETRGLVVTLSGSVLFRSGEAKLLPSAQTQLGQVADALLATKDRTLLIEGHTDSQGTEEYNVDLGRQRADAVLAFLTSRGYDPKLVRAVGVGEARPVADNDTPEGRANNRRVEIVIEPGATASGE